MTFKIIVDSCCKIPNAHIKGRRGRGKSACGVLFIDEAGNEHEYSKFLGEMTVPQAEFSGLIYALDKATEHTRREVEVWMDSELVIKWMTGEYRMRKDHIKPLYDKAKSFELRYKKVEYFHHPRTADLAKRVDILANQEYEKNIQ